MIAGKLLNVLFQNVLVYTESIIGCYQLNLVGNILITSDDAFSIKRNVLK